MRDFDAAIAAAEDARKAPERADSADSDCRTRAARAFSRERGAGRPGHARSGFAALRPSASPPANGWNSLSALAKLSTWIEAPGAAAAVFDSVLASDATLLAERDRCSTGGRQRWIARRRPRPEFERQALYRARARPAWRANLTATR